MPDYLGGHVLVSMTALALGLAVSLPLAFVSMRRPALRRILLTLASIVQTIPGLALLALFYPLLLALAALSTERVFGVRLLRARTSCPRCWRLRSTACCRCCGTRSPGSRHRPGGHGSRARRRHDAAAVADDGRAAARAAGDHGGHSHRGGVGDRHRDAVDADRTDEPRQLHLHRPADPELGVRAVRLRRGGTAGARRRPVAGADRDRRRAAQTAIACCRLPVWIAASRSR